MSYDTLKNYWAGSANVVSKVAKSDSSTKVTAITPANKFQSWFSEFSRKIKWRARWLFPNLIFAKSKIDLEFYKKLDVESNLESRAPETEELRVQIVWGAEVYGPSETDNLYENLTRLGWTAGMGSQKAGGAATWVRGQRSYGQGGWYNVGVVSSPSDRHKYIFPTNELRMPEKVEYLIVQIFQLTPALTCVVIGFVLKEDLRVIYDSALRENRVGCFERCSRKSILRVSPEELKRRSIIKSREIVRRVAQTWFQSNLPGYFCNSDIHRLPTAELITTTTDPLLPGEYAGFTGDKCWKDVVVSSSSNDIWSSSDGKGIRFVNNRNRLKDEPLHLVVSLCKSNVSDEEIRDRGEKNNSAFISYSADQMAGVISSFASIGFLTEALKDLRLSRASLKIHKVKRSKGLHALEKIQAFFDRSLGTPVIAKELLSRSEHAGGFIRECGAFTTPGWLRDDARRTVAKELCAHTNSLASQVIIEEHSLREHLEQLSSIISVRESVKAQRRVGIFTFFTLLVAVASMVIAATQNTAWVDELLVFVTNLFDIVMPEK